MEEFIDAYRKVCDLSLCFAILFLGLGIAAKMIAYTNEIAVFGFIASQLFSVATSLGVVGVTMLYYLWAARIIIPVVLWLEKDHEAR